MPPSESSPLLTSHSASSNLLTRSLSRSKRVGWRKSLLNLQRTFSGDSLSDYEEDGKRKTRDYDPTGLQHDLADSVGVRTWTASYASIDWLHDEVKEHLRKSKLRALPGLRGFLLNAWDRSQGYVVATIVGLMTALFAFGIVRSEAWLFDLKDGYCVAGWQKTKRMCCPHEKVLSEVPMAFFQLWKKKSGHSEVCRDWRTWAEILNGTIAKDSFVVDYIAQIIIGLCFAFVSALLTVYVSSSANVVSSKDSIHGVQLPDAQGIQRKIACTFFLSPKDWALARTCILTLVTVACSDFAAGSGIPEVKTVLSGFVIRGYLGLHVLFTKAVGLPLSVASGLNLGKEGPMVQIACCIGNLTTRLFPKYDTNEAKRREILSAACAAGVSVAFGSPVGGVLFSLEETSYYFGSKTMVRCLWSAAVAYLALKMLNPFGTGSVVLFEITYDRSFAYLELIPYALLGVVGGLYGAAFNRLNFLYSSRVRSKTWMSRHPILEVLLITTLTLVVAPFNRFTNMGGTELVAELFSECHADSTLNGLCVASAQQIPNLLGLLAVAALVKGALTVVTFGIKVPAGIFIPTLAVGALLGRSCGLLIEATFARFPSAGIFQHCDIAASFGQQCTIPGMFAIVGAAATLAGVTRTTVSLGIIVSELTGSIQYVVPVLLAVLVAKTVGEALEPMSIYDLVLVSSNLPYLDSKIEIVHHVNVSDVVDARASTIDIDGDNTVSSLSSLLRDAHEKARSAGFPLVRHDGPHDTKVVGYIGSQELRVGLERIGMADGNLQCTFGSASGGISPYSTLTAGAVACDLGSLVDRAPICVSIRSPMELLHQLFLKLGTRYLLVVDDRGSYVGIVEKQRWLGYLEWAEEHKNDYSTTPHF